jgi:LysW-gamma-L-lysine carboxypeptidase
VRVEAGKLFGRGAVDAKGPLAAFAAAAAQVAPPAGWRIVVIGAVEEEAATSKGARYAATQYRPALCVIGEPSGWNRVTLGYKGRLLAHLAMRQPMSHTAGPATSVCEQAVAYWNRVASRVAEINAGRVKAWEQVLPSLRSFRSDSDGLYETAQMLLGFRLPLDCGPEAIQAELRAIASVVQAEAGSPARTAELRFEGAEEAFRADKNNPLVRALLAAIRSHGEQPGFVVKTGTSDMNVVGPAWQCPIVAYGPGDSSLDHTPDEHVAIDEWQRGVCVLVATLRQLVDAA